MTRTFRQQFDEGILDRAAALFARRGFEQTSVQAVADAVGLSKAGLLHHFPSKEALREAVLAQAESLGQRVLQHVQDLPLGMARDRRAVDVIVDVALAYPGLVALMLVPATQDGAVAARSGDVTTVAVLQAFGVDLATTDQERLVRVIGALSALAVLTLAAHHQDTTTAWRPLVVATCFDALGHRRTDALSARPDQVEA
ncbi:MAG: transcriptional regulator, TetR family [Blastococcus sp.]|nr:transcriptional regulator, TetR family [Blastococcus sp.]